MIIERGTRYPAEKNQAPWRGQKEGCNMFTKQDVMGVLKDGTPWHLDPWTGEFELYTENVCGEMEWQVVHGDDESMTLAQLATAHESIETAAREWGAEYGIAWMDQLDEKDTFWRDGPYDWGNALFYTDDDKKCAREELFEENEDEDWVDWLDNAFDDGGWLGLIIIKAGESAVEDKWEEMNA